jgi:uncharacterized protein (TIGR02117 family)
MRFFRRLLLRILLAVLAVPVLYGAAALGLGLLPASHRDPVPGQPTLPVYLISNGWHVWLALPIRAENTDWDAWLNADSGPSNTQGDYVAFGWGDRDFYLATRRPVDFRPDLAVAALLGRGPAAMHVMRMAEPDLAAHQTRRLEVDSLQYHALAAYIRAGFDSGPDGRPRRLPEAGFGETDAFYEAVGRYSPVRTCNEWISAGLRAAGLPTGWWTPFPFGLMRGRS